MEEIWKNIEGYEGLYQVSNLGRVKSLKYGKEKLMKPFKAGIGYLEVFLCKYGKRKPHLVHRLVARAFIDNPDNLPFINHKDECKTNNFVDNLEWCTRQYNNTYGTLQQRKGKKLSKTVLQYSLDGKFIKEYTSAREAQRKLGYSQGNISSCCRGIYKQAYGFIWRYNKEPQSN